MSRRSRFQRNGCLDNHIQKWFRDLTDKGVIKPNESAVTLFPVVTEYLSNRLLKYICSVQSNYADQFVTAAESELTDRKILGKEQRVL